MLKPDRKSNLAYYQGMKAYDDGVKMEDNPHCRGPVIAWAAWWDKGWMDRMKNKPRNDLLDEAR